MKSRKAFLFLLALSCVACVMASGCGDEKKTEQKQAVPATTLGGVTTITKDGVTYNFAGKTRYAAREDVAAWIKKLQEKYPGYKNWTVTEHLPSELGEVSVTMLGYGPKHQALYKDAEGKERKGFDYADGQIYIMGCKCHKIWDVRTSLRYHMGENNRKFTKEKLFNLPKDEQYYQKKKDGKMQLYHSVCMGAAK